MSKAKAVGLTHKCPILATWLVTSSAPDNNLFVTLFTVVFKFNAAFNVVVLTFNFNNVLVVVFDAA